MGRPRKEPPILNIRADQLLTVEEVAELTGYNPDAIQRMVRNGNLKVTRQRPYLIPAAELVKFNLVETDGLA